MLDFYLINDEQSHSSKNAGFEFAGRLNEQTFEDLQQKKIIEERFNYYRDFRWSSGQVKQKFTQLKKQPTKEKSVVTFLAILEKAVSQKSGLMAYAD